MKVYMQIKNYNFDKKLRYLDMESQPTLTSNKKESILCRDFFSVFELGKPLVIEKKDWWLDSDLLEQKVCFFSNLIPNEWNAIPSFRGTINIICKVSDSVGNTRIHHFVTRVGYGVYCDQPNALLVGEEQYINLKNIKNCFEGEIKIDNYKLIFELVEHVELSENTLQHYYDKN